MVLVAAKILFIIFPILQQVVKRVIWSLVVSKYDPITFYDKASMRIINPRGSKVVVFYLKVNTTNVGSYPDINLKC